AVASFDAVAGFEPQTETVWRQADRYHVPRICFINKMDRIGADFERTVHMIEERLHAVPLVTQIPWGAEASCVGVLELIEMKGLRWTEEMGENWESVEIPAELQAQAAEWRHRLYEQLADHDEALFEKYVHGEEPTIEDLRRALRKATLEVT